MKNHFLLLIFSLLVFPSPSWSYVCSRVPDSTGQETGPSLSWYTRSITFALQQDGTTDIAGDQELDELRDSFAVWEENLAANAGNTCDPQELTTDLVFTESNSLSSSTLVGYDFLNPSKNENLLLFQDTSWPHAGTSGIILALTTNTYNALTGEIFDSDIEFNSSNFTFTLSSNSNPQTDLKNTAVHEIGHFIGLGHVPIRAATMYEQASTAETKKRDLHCDDAEATHFKYPFGLPNGYCTPTEACGFCAPPDTISSTVQVKISDTNPDSTSGCQCAAGQTGWLGFAWLLLLRKRRERA